MAWKTRLLIVAITMASVTGIAVAMRPAARPIAENALMYDTLPFYTGADLLPHWHGADKRRIGSFHLQDQQGQVLDEHVFVSGPTVVNFFFGGCTTVCPASMELLNLTRKDMATEAPAFLSISVTPLADSPAALRSYAKRIGLPADWRLTTGVPKDVFAMARNDLLTDIEKTGPDGLPPHTERALLIDIQGRIRGVYNANTAVDLMRMRYDLRRLRQEMRTAS